MTPRDLVDKFLRSLEARDLPTAAAFLAPGMVMTFPGNKRMASLQELVAWSKDRYRKVTKTYHRFDEFTAGDVTTIYCSGVLNGEWISGQPLKDIRFIDRFEIKNGLITDQQVWNDLAEFRP